MGLACEFAGAVMNDFEGVMRNTRLSTDGECDPTALEKLKGSIRTMAEDLAKQRGEGSEPVMRSGDLFYT